LQQNKSNRLSLSDVFQPNGLLLLLLLLLLTTHTNFILASMLAADLVNAVIAFFYSPFIVFVFVFDSPCRHNVLIASLTPLLKIPGAVSIYHLVLISAERYVAIVYPLRYEARFNDRTIDSHLDHA